MISSHAPFHIVNCPMNQEYVISSLDKGFNSNNDGSGNQCSVYLKIWIFCGGADKNQRPVFHKRQKIILLSFVEAVNLIYKQNRPFSVHSHGMSLAFCTTSSISFFPATVALIWVNSALVVLAITFASVVFPVPGGP